MASTDLQQLQNPARNQMPVSMSFFNLEGFELMQRIAKAFASSDLVPQAYQGNLPNCMIALDMAQRIGANPLMCMQNLYIVHGTPGWSSKFLIATVNTCGRFSALRYEWKGKPGEADYGCRAWAVERETNERLDGIWVTWAMVKAEGWSGKKGSKWLTMPDQMFLYRAAAFWQRVYAPDLAMGLQTAEEVRDVYDAGKGSDGSFSVTMGELAQAGRIGSESQEMEPEPEPVGVDTETGEIAEPQADPEPEPEQPKQTRQRREPEPEPEGDSDFSMD